MPLAPIAVTMGEPAGVGPELIASLWQDRDTLGLPPFCYLGMPAALPSGVPFMIISDPKEALDVFSNALPVLEIVSTAEIIVGQPSQATGHAVIQAIDTATKLALEGSFSAIVTAPIHKAVLYEAGFTAPGHTEYLARLCSLRDSDSIMMLATDGLRVVPVTIHIALKDVPKVLTTDKIVHAGATTAADLRDRFGIEKPKLAIAALNPHAGEGGSMGMEEATHIQPAIWQLQDMGIDAVGPLPADTLFHKEAREKYDAVLCMYHDQALIPIKAIDFWGGVNITLGLPIIRTSPDHGTAHRIAGKGLARRDSMLAAINMAASMAEKAS